MREGSCGASENGGLPLFSWSFSSLQLLLRGRNSLLALHARAVGRWARANYGVAAAAEVCPFCEGIVRLKNEERGTGQTGIGGGKEV